MASKKQKKSGSPMIALMAVGVLGLGALAAYVKFGGADKVPTEVRRVESLQKKDPPAGKTAHEETTQKTTVELFTPSRDSEELKFTKHQSDVPEGEDARLFALNHFLRESKIADPKAKVVGIQVKDQVALIDASPEFNQTYGTFDEEAILKGISITLAQFKDIEKVQFFVEGKPVTTLGNVDLSEPISVRTKSNAEPGAW